MTARLDLAVEKGCDGVEPDNVQVSTTPSVNSCISFIVKNF